MPGGGGSSGVNQPAAGRNDTATGGFQRGPGTAANPPGSGGR